MADRVVTVPDSLEIPADVKVPSGRLSDSTAAGRALLAGADDAAQRASLGLGTAATHAHGDYATAAQGVKADASDVHQITLTGDLVLTLPVGHPAGQVYRCAITQPATPPTGYTVTYDGTAVTVGTSPGAVTLVELHPVGAGYVVRYPAKSSQHTPVPTPTPPQSPEVGQLWYSSAFEHLRAPRSLAHRSVVFTKTGAWEGQALQEASVWIAGGHFKALFTAGLGLGFASCPLASDPTDPASWSRPATYPTPVVSGAKHASIYVEGDIIHLYYTDAATSAGIWHATAALADAVPAFGTATQVLTLPAGSNVFGNTFVVKDGTTYRMMVEHKATGTGRWQQGWASASNPAGPWAIEVNTLQSLWPEANRQGSGGAWLTQENGKWVLWFHSSWNWNGLLPSDIYRATAPVLGADNWTLTDNGQPVITRRAAHEVDQVADVELIRAPDGAAYAFWTGMHNRGAQFVGAISCARLLPTMLRWDGARWAPAEEPDEPGYSIVDTGRPRTAMVTADFTNSTADGVTWVSIPGANVTHRNSGPDVEVEFRTACSASGSAGYKYEFRVMRGGSDPKPLGSMAGNAGNMSSYVGVARYTQLAPGSANGFEIQVRVPTGGGSFNLRPATFPEREFGVIKITDIAYP